MPPTDPASMDMADRLQVCRSSVIHDVMKDLGLAVRGDIVDGGCRDEQAITGQGFPVFARFCTPIDIVCAWRAEAGEGPQAAHRRHRVF
jgi:hypothetical protein